MTPRYTHTHTHAYYKMQYDFWRTVRHRGAFLQPPQLWWFKKKENLLKLRSLCQCIPVNSAILGYTHTHFTNACLQQWRHKSHWSGFTEAISASSGTCGRGSSSACGAGLCLAWDDDCLNSEHAAVPTRWVALCRPQTCSSIKQQIVI